MKLKTKTSKKRLIVIIITVFFFVAIAAGAFVFYRAKKAQNQTNNDSSSFQDAEPLSPEDKKQQESYEQQKKQDTANSSDHSEDTSRLDVHFTAVNQYENTAQIRAEIAGLISDGTCSLTLTKDGATVTKNASTQAGASTSTCQGFDIPVSELSPGEWSIHLNVTHNDHTGNAKTTLTIS